MHLFLQTLRASAVAAAKTPLESQDTKREENVNEWQLFCYPGPDEKISKILQDWDTIFKTSTFSSAVPKSKTKFSMRPSASILNMWWNQESGQVARGELQTYNMTAPQIYEMITEQESPSDEVFEKAPIAANADWLLCGVQQEEWKRLQVRTSVLTSRECSALGQVETKIVSTSGKSQGLGLVAAAVAAAPAKGGVNTDLDAERIGRMELLLNHGPYPKWNGLWIWLYFVFAHL